MSFAIEDLLANVSITRASRLTYNFSRTCVSFDGLFGSLGGEARKLLSIELASL